MVLYNYVLFIVAIPLIL